MRVKAVDQARQRLTALQIDRKDPRSTAQALRGYVLSGVFFAQLSEETFQNIKFGGGGFFQRNCVVVVGLVITVVGDSPQHAERSAVDIADMTYRAALHLADYGAEIVPEFIDKVLAVASGEKARNEENGYREISIFKNGVTL